MLAVPLFIVIHHPFLLAPQLQKREKEHDNKQYGSHRRGIAHVVGLERLAVDIQRRVGSVIARPAVSDEEGLVKGCMVPVRETDQDKKIVGVIKGRVTFQNI